MKGYKQIGKTICSRFALLLLLGFLFQGSSSYAQCPNAQLEVDGSANGCVPSPISFKVKNLPSGYTDLKWDWTGSGDTLRDIDSAQTHTYQNPGDYNPSVVVYGPNGDSLCKLELANANKIQIFDNPSADFTVQGVLKQCFEGNKFCVNLKTQRAQSGAPIKQSTFTWGDGTKDTGSAIDCHQYKNSREFTQILQVTDTNGCTDLEEKRSHVEVLEPLNPRFSVQFPEGQPGCPETPMRIVNNTNDSGRFESLTYIMADSSKMDTTEYYDNTLFQKGFRQDYEASNLWASPGDPNGWSDVTYTYKEDGEFFPTVIMRDTLGCSDTFKFQAGARNISFFMDTTPFIDTACFSDPSIRFKHSVRENAFANTWNFRHPPPPLPIVQNQWSGSHQYPSVGVKDISLRITEIPGRCVRDTLYYSQAAVTGPEAIINTSPMVAPPNTIVKPKDRPIFKSRFLNARGKGCLEIDSIPYVRRSNTGGFTGITEYWKPSEPLPYSLQTFDVTSDTFYHRPDSNWVARDSFVFQEFDLIDAIQKSSVEVDFIDTSLQLAYNKDYKTNNHNDTFIDVKFHNGKAYIVWDTTKKPEKPPYRFLVNFRAGDSTVYEPESGALSARNMHDSDLYDPDCHAPNLVRFTNNSKKFRLVRNEEGSNRVKRIDPNTPFKIDSVAPNGLDTFYVVDSISPSGDTFLANDYYKGFKAPSPVPTDNDAPIFVKDTSVQQFRENHKALVQYYKDRGFDQFTVVDTTVDEDKDDDLSPWGSDSMNYVWQFADPKGEGCTTHSAWASQQKYLYRQVRDTVVVPNFSGNQVKIRLERFLPTDYNDTVYNARSDIRYINKPIQSDTLFDFYGEHFDVKYHPNKGPVLRIWDPNVSQGDSVIFTIYGGDTTQSGRLCNFSTAKAPYHFYDSTGCFTATLMVEDTVTNCTHTDNERIHMEPPRADWDREFFHQRRTKVLSNSYGGTKDSFLLDSLYTAQDSTKWAARVLGQEDGKPVMLFSGNSRIPSKRYEVKDYKQAWVVLDDDNSFRNNIFGKSLQASYHVKSYAILAGDTFNIEQMNFATQRQLPPYQPSSPDLFPRRGFIINGPKCQFEVQELVFDETVPYTSCQSSGQDYGVIFDTGGFNHYFGESFNQGTKNCIDSFDTDNDGAFDTAINVNRSTFNWIPAQVWGAPLIRAGPNRFRYRTAGCKDVGVWIKSGNCIDTHYYEDYKRINSLDFRFNVLDPDTLDPLTETEKQERFCVKKIGDSLSLPISPVNGGQRQITQYGGTIQKVPRGALVGKSKTPPSQLTYGPVEQEYDLVKDTVFRFCDSVGTVDGEKACFGRNFIWPTITCGKTPLNQRSVSQLTQEFTVFDTFTVLDMGDTLTADSIDHSNIGVSSSPTPLFKVPNKSKAWWFYIKINKPLNAGNNFYVVSMRNQQVNDTLFRINDAFPTVGQVDSVVGLNHYAGDIDDSTTLGVIKSDPSTQGNITIWSRYKPVLDQLKVERPGIYEVRSSMTNASGCSKVSGEAGVPPQQVKVGHYARFDPLTLIPTKNDSTICAGDTVYFHNDVSPSRGRHSGFEFPRYWQRHNWPVDPRVAHNILWPSDTTNFWRDPKGTRSDWSLAKGYQYERLRWDLNGDGYFETVYDIDALRYIQDKDMDSTFEDTLALQDVDQDNNADTVPYYVYEEGGLYDVRMKSTDSSGCSQIMEKENLIVATEVTAYMDTLVGPSVCAPQTVDFVDSSDIGFGYRYTRDSAGNKIDSVAVDSVIDWQWDFNDGKGDQSTASIEKPSYVYTRNGDFIPELIVETSTGCIDTTNKVKHGPDTSDLLIRIRGPRPYFELLDSLKCEPGKITVFDTSSGGSKWNYKKGNGEEITFDSLPSDSTFTLEYENAGRYKIGLTLFDSVANTATPDPNDSLWCGAPFPDTTFPGYNPKDYEIRIKGTDKAAFNPVPKDLCPNHGQKLTLQNESDPLYRSFTWAMGNGDTLQTVSMSDSTIDASDTTYLYTENAYDTFDITLMPSGPDSMCFDTATEEVRTSGIKADFDTASLNMPVYKFENQSEFGEEYRWIFFDGKIDTSRLGDPDFNIGNLPRYRHPRNDNDKNDFKTEDRSVTPTMDYHADRGFYDVALIATNPEGCKDTSVMRIKNFFDTSYQRSNVFTPNGDGKNDRFTFRMQGDKEYTMKIYNRWGEVVYETSRGADNNECFWSNEVSEFSGDCSNPNPENPRGCKYCKFWDGTLESGAEAPSGTYYFKITYRQRHSEEKTQHGTVTLIR